VCVSSAALSRELLAALPFAVRVVARHSMSINSAKAVEIVPDLKQLIADLIRFFISQSNAADNTVHTHI